MRTKPAKRDEFSSSQVAWIAIFFAISANFALFSSGARAWEPFRSENGHVRTGNERFDADPEGALSEYELAARELPGEARVHLNRGLALLSLGRLDEARSALLLATEPPADREIRAAAYYNMGLAFYRQGDDAAAGRAGPGPNSGDPNAAPPPMGEPDHEAAQRHFREAADAFRRSLRIRPGNADAGWNLELALRRIREEEQRQEEQEQQEQEQQEQSQDQEQQDQEGQDQEGQEGQDQEQQEGQDQEGQDQEGQEGGGEDQESDPEDAQSPEEEQQPAQDQEDPGDQGEGESPDGTPEDPGSQDGLPPDARRVLDALQDSEDNLERHRARARAARDGRRPPARDW